MRMLLACATGMSTTTGFPWRSRALAELVVLRAGRSLFIRETVATPVQKLIQDGQVNPLLDGATFGTVAASTSAKGVEVINVRD